MEKAFHFLFRRRSLSYLDLGYRWGGRIQDFWAVVNTGLQLVVGLLVGHGTDRLLLLRVQQIDYKNIKAESEQIQLTKARPSEPCLIYRERWKLLQNDKMGLLVYLDDFLGYPSLACSSCCFDGKSCVYRAKMYTMVDLSGDQLTDFWDWLSRHNIRLNNFNIQKDWVDGVVFAFQGLGDATKSVFSQVYSEFCI